MVTGLNEILLTHGTKGRRMSTDTDRRIPWLRGICSRGSLLVVLKAELETSIREFSISIHEELARISMSC